MSECIESVLIIIKDEFRNLTFDERPSVFIQHFDNIAQKPKIIASFSYFGLQTGIGNRYYDNWIKEFRHKSQSSRFECRVTNFFMLKRNHFMTMKKLILASSLAITFVSATCVLSANPETTDKTEISQRLYDAGVPETGFLTLKTENYTLPIDAASGWTIDKMCFHGHQFGLSNGHYGTVLRPKGGPMVGYRTQRRGARNSPSLTTDR